MQLTRNACVERPRWVMAWQLYVRVFNFEGKRVLWSGLVVGV